MSARSSSPWRSSAATRMTASGLKTARAVDGADGYGEAALIELGSDPFAKRVALAEHHDLPHVERRGAVQEVVDDPDASADLRIEAGGLDDGGPGAGPRSSRGRSATAWGRSSSPANSGKPKLHAAVTISRVLR